jgi:hypothetical protein
MFQLWWLAGHLPLNLLVKVALIKSRHLKHFIAASFVKEICMYIS